MKLNFYLYRAKDSKKKGDISSAHKFLKSALESIKEIERKHINILVELMLELSEMYIHYRKDKKKAYYYLDTIKNYITSKKKISELKRANRWNLLMSDFYKILAKNNEIASQYKRESKNIKNQLRVIGVVE